MVCQDLHVYHNEANIQNVKTLYLNFVRFPYRTTTIHISPITQHYLVHSKVSVSSVVSVVFSKSISHLIQLNFKQVFEDSNSKLDILNIDFPEECNCQNSWSYLTQKLWTNTKPRKHWLPLKYSTNEWKTT